MKYSRKIQARATSVGLSELQPVKVTIERPAMPMTADAISLRRVNIFLLNVCVMFECQSG